MKLRDRLAMFFASKESQARIMLSVNQVGNPQTSPVNYETYAREGYSKNVIVYRCISLIARACAGIEIDVYSKRGGDKELENHPLKLLIDKPNPMQGRSSFIEAFIAYYLLTGNTYVEKVRAGKQITELWNVRPDKIEIVPGPKGYPAKYVFKTPQGSKEWPVDMFTLRSDLHHMKSFNPLNDWFGMSPLQAAIFSIDSNNQGKKWNLALLQNSATPSGVLKVVRTEVNPGGTLSEEVFNRLKEEFTTSYVGARNAGKPLLLEGGLDWQAISLSPKEMEFLKGQEVTAIDICNIFGVPPEMLGLGQKTYANYEEARMSFMEDTVLPLMDQSLGDLNNCFSYDYTDGAYLKYDKDDIEALEPKRAKKITSLQNANWLTQNEKRQATGYEEKPGWDVFIIGNQLLETPDDMAEETEDTDPNAEVPDDEAQDMGTVQQPPKRGGQADQEGNEEAGDQDDEKSFKNFNLLNNAEKQNAWRRQNRRRSKLEKNFTRDLGADFQELISDMKKAVAGKTSPQVIEFALLKAVDDNMPTIRKTLQRHIKYTVDDFGSMVLDEAKSLWPGVEKKATRQWDDWAKRYVDTRTGNAVSQIEETTRKKAQNVIKKLVEAAVLDGETTQDVASGLLNEFSTVSKSRAHLIARTEVASASNNASLNAAKSLQIPQMFKEWVSSQDDRVRSDSEVADHEVMDGQEVPLDDKFTVPPDADMDGPGDMSAGAEQVCNCRCVLTFKSRNNGEL